jgi:hypothetical protein
MRTYSSSPQLAALSGAQRSVFRPLSAASCSMAAAAMAPLRVRNPTLWELPQAACAVPAALAHSRGSVVSPRRHACIQCPASLRAPGPTYRRHACTSASRRAPGPMREAQESVIDVVPEISSMEKMQMVAEIAQTKSYLELKALMQKWRQDPGGDMAAYLMLQAANLRATVEMHAMADLEVGQAATLVETKDLLVQRLLPTVEQHIHEYPLSTQCTLVSALAQLQCDSESVFSAVAHSCCQAGDATGGMADALAAAAPSASPSDPVILPPRPHAAPDDQQDPPGPRVRDEHGRLGLQLMMLSSGFALAGHYDQRLFHLIARQTVQFLDSIADMPTLINILGAFMDVQHLDRSGREEVGGEGASQLSRVLPLFCSSMFPLTFPLPSGLQAGSWWSGQASGLPRTWAPSRVTMLLRCCSSTPSSTSRTPPSTLGCWTRRPPSSPSTLSMPRLPRHSTGEVLSSLRGQDGPEAEGRRQALLRMVHQGPLDLGCLHSPLLRCFLLPGASSCSPSRCPSPQLSALSSTVPCSGTARSSCR